MACRVRFDLSSVLRGHALKKTLELYSRDALRSAKRIANPGCYATNTQVLLAPLLPHLDPSQSPTVFGISGYSGAGTKSGTTPKISPDDLRGGVRPYALTDHIHEREAGHHLSRHTSAPSSGISLAFTPSVAPWFQGIISTVSAPLAQSMRAEDVRRLFEEAYGKERLIEVVKGVPDVIDIAGQHGVRVGGFQVHSSGKRVVAVVCPSLSLEERC